MFVGHAAIALAGKSRSPTLPLGWLFAATFGLDLLWPVFLLLGIEQVSIPPVAAGFANLSFDWYPWSHSLLMALVWGGLAAALARWRGRSVGEGWLLGGVVLSHWVLDAVSHPPDLPLSPGESTVVGLGLWRSIPATLLVEGGLYLAGIALYCRATRARDGIGRFALPVLLLLCAVMWASTPWSPPPPSSRALAWFSFGLWGFVAWAGWGDAHRIRRSS